MVYFVNGIQIITAIFIYFNVIKHEDKIRKLVN